jgi:hypothetical protein
MRAGIIGILIGVSTALSLKDGNKCNCTASLFSIFLEVITIVSLALLSSI